MIQLGSIANGGHKSTSEREMVFCERAPSWEAAGAMEAAVLVLPSCVGVVKERGQGRGRGYGSCCACASPRKEARDGPGGNDGDAEERVGRRDPGTGRSSGTSGRKVEEGGAGRRVTSAGWGTCSSSVTF